MGREKQTDCGIQKKQTPSHCCLIRMNTDNGKSNLEYDMKTLGTAISPLQVILVIIYNPISKRISPSKLFDYI